MATAQQDRDQTAPTVIRARGMRQFIVGMLAYALVVVLQVVLVEPEGLAVWAGIALALLPMVCAVWAMAGWLRAVRTFDELRQKIFTEAALVSFGLTAIATFTYGFLEVFLGLPKLSMFIVFPFMGACYSLSLGFVMRRYQ